MREDTILTVFCPFFRIGIDASAVLNVIQGAIAEHAAESVLRQVMAGIILALFVEKIG